MHAARTCGASVAAAPPPPAGLFGPGAPGRPGPGGYPGGAGGVSEHGARDLVGGGADVAGLDAGAAEAVVDVGVEGDGGALGAPVGAGQR